MPAMVQETTDEALAAKAAAGDREAFETLVARYTGPLLAFCRHLMAEEAEDRVQEAFVRAFRNLGKFREPLRFSAWIHKIAQNLCIDALRARKLWEPLRRNAVSDAPPLADERLDRVEQVVSRLPAKYRAIFHYKYKLGWTSAEIADQLDTSHEDVRICLHRAIHSLREKLGT